MPHGTPDWGLVGPKETIYGLDDLGEHAVRGGSPHLWDRRGDVIFQTIFAEGLEGCVAGGLLAGDAANLFTGPARQGAFCVELVELGEVGHGAIVYKYLPVPVQSWIGIEATFMPDMVTESAEIWLIGSDGVTTWEAAVRFDPQTGNVAYWTGAGAWVNFGSIPTFLMITYPPYTMKFVMDYLTHVYVRAILDNVEWDIAHVPVVNAGVVTNVYLRGMVEVHAVADETTHMYVDSLIITQNEP